MSALKGIRIVELAEGPAGEYCGKLLADFGAEVIKVERPETGSLTRALGPFKGDGEGFERSGLFAFLNTNKRSVALDVVTEGDLLARLLANADAVIDDHAPGWLASLGLAPEDIATRYPALSLCMITPFGQAAPEDRRHAEDLTLMHASGWGYHTPSQPDTSRPPLKGAGRFLPSYEAGLEGAMCLAACIHDAKLHGKGRIIDISKQAVLASRVDYVLGQMVAGDMDVGTSRAAFDLSGPAGIFACRGGFAYLWMSTPAHWQAIGTMLGQPAWMVDFPPNWLERGLTEERIALVRAKIAEWLLTQDKDEVSAQAQSLGLTMVPVNVASDLVRNPQFQHRAFFSEIDHPVLGRATYPGVPYRMSATPARIEHAAPLLGEMEMSA